MNINLCLITGFLKGFQSKLLGKTNYFKRTMSGTRFYIQSKQLKELNRESQVLGIGLNELISLKLKRELFESLPDSKLSLRLERCELILSQLSEDLNLVRNATSNCHK
ncbi:MAG: hypothetical protein QNJ72_23850 [Pleurocapsa sp. MO_226.B13]|nr:hypothetical protein [Pleurocapsa sp. MO_226.B13]